MARSRSRESKRVLCGVLAILVPWLPLHRLVLGDVMGAVVRLLLILVGVGIAINFLEGILYLAKSDAEFTAIYEDGRKAWF